MAPTELVPLTSLSKKQMWYFAQAMQNVAIRSPQDREKRLQHCYGRLERRLLRPDFVSRVLTGGQSQYTTLCADHKALNASPVHSLFLLIQTEVGVRLNSVVQAGRERVGPELWDYVILNLRSLHALWLPPAVFMDTFAGSLDLLDGPVELKESYYRKWQYQGKRPCEACIISKITGNPQTLFGLRSVARARQFMPGKESPHTPRILPWVETWLSLGRRMLTLAEDHRALDQSVINSTRDGKILFQLRKELYHERHPGRRGKIAQVTSTKNDVPASHHANDHSDGRVQLTGPGSRPIPPSDAAQNGYAEAKEDSSAHDAEHEVIDAYAALISTPFRPAMSPAEHASEEKRLSTFALARISVASTVGAEASHLRSNTYPYASRAKQMGQPDALAAMEETRGADSGLARVQSYVPARAAWKKADRDATKGSPVALVVLDELLDLYPAKISDPDRAEDWADASVPPSTVSLPQTDAGHNDAPGVCRKSNELKQISEERGIPEIRKNKTQGDKQRSTRHHSVRPCSSLILGDNIRPTQAWFQNCTATIADDEDLVPSLISTDKSCEGSSLDDSSAAVSAKTPPTSLASGDATESRASPKPRMIARVPKVSPSDPVDVHKASRETKDTAAESHVQPPAIPAPKIAPTPAPLPSRSHSEPQKKPENGGAHGEVHALPVARSKTVRAPRKVTRQTTYTGMCQQLTEQQSQPKIAARPAEATQAARDQAVETSPPVARSDTQTALDRHIAEQRAQALRNLEGHGPIYEDPSLINKTLVKMRKVMRTGRL